MPTHVKFDTRANILVEDDRELSMRAQWHSNHRWAIAAGTHWLWLVSTIRWRPIRRRLVLVSEVPKGVTCLTITTSVMNRLES